MTEMKELTLVETTNVDGGFVPLVIFGVALSAKAVAGIAGTLFLTGVGVGAMVASDQATN